MFVCVYSSKITLRCCLRFKLFSRFLSLLRLLSAKTREHLLSHLKSSDNTTNEKSASALIQALQKTMLFEKEMTARLSRDHGVVLSSASDMIDDLEFDEDGKSVAANSAKGIRVRHARNKARQDASSSIASGSETDTVGKKVITEKLLPLIGKASSVFEAYMEPYISLERQNMSEQLAKAAKDTAVDSRGELPVFTTSTDLFVYIKNSVTRCTVLSKDRTFFLLYEVFRESLEKYSKVMYQKMPSSVSTTGSFAFGSSNILSSTVQYRIPQGEEVTICHVINTCEYCSETIDALQELITEQISEIFKGKIDMSSVQDSFNETLARAIQILAAGLESRIESSLKEISNTSWGSVELVGEESDYVRSMHKEIESFVDIVRELIPASYFKNFCDKFSYVIINSFMSALSRIKRISESGTQQLLLDVYNLKTLILKLAVIGQNPAPAMYTKTVSKEFARIEVLLKLVGTPSELLPDMFMSTWTSGTSNDLQLIMDMKGLPKKDQNSILEKVGFKSSPSLTGSSSSVGNNVRQFGEKIKAGIEVAQNTPATSSTSVSDNLRQFSENRAAVAAKVNSDFSSMRLKVESFTKALGSKS